MFHNKVFSILNKQWLLWIGLFLTSTLGMFVIYSSTPYGIGQINDSAAYIGGARSIAAGTGYSKLWLDGGEQRPITAYPPLTSIVLACLTQFGIDPFDGFRLMNILLFGVVIFLTGTICSSFTGRSWMGLLAAILFASNRVLITLYSYAISETLYIFLMLLGCEVFYLWSYKKKNGFVLALGIILGLATLTRNAGLALLISFGMCLIFMAENRIKSIVILILGYLPVILPWTIRNWGYEYLMDSPRALDSLLIQQGGRNLLNWFFISSSEAFQPTLIFWVEIAFYCLLITGLLTRRHDLTIKSFRENPLVLFVAIHLIVYTGTLAFSILYVEESIGLSDRILSPIYTTLFLGFVWIWSQGWSENIFKKFTFVALLLTLVVVNIRETQITVGKLSDDGLGYSSLRFRVGPIANALKYVAPEVVIFTNSPPALYSATGGNRSSKGFGVTEDTNPEALLGYFVAVAQGQDFVLVCYGCPQKVYLRIQPITDSMDLIATYGRDAVYYWHSSPR